jgi:hypothetical protein
MIRYLNLAMVEKYCIYKMSNKPSSNGSSTNVTAAELKDMIDKQHNLIERFMTIVVAAGISTSSEPVSVQSTPVAVSLQPAAPVEPIDATAAIYPRRRKRLPIEEEFVTDMAPAAPEPKFTPAAVSRHPAPNSAWNAPVQPPRPTAVNSVWNGNIPSQIRSPPTYAETRREPANVIVAPAPKVADIPKMVPSVPNNMVAPSSQIGAPDGLFYTPVYYDHNKSIMMSMEYDVEPTLAVEQWLKNPTAPLYMCVWHLMHCGGSPKPCERGKYCSFVHPKLRVVKNNETGQLIVLVASSLDHRFVLDGTWRPQRHLCSQSNEINHAELIKNCSFVHLNHQGVSLFPTAPTYDEVHEGITRMRERSYRQPKEEPIRPKPMAPPAPAPVHQMPVYQEDDDDDDGSVVSLTRFEDVSTSSGPLPVPAQSVAYDPRIQTTTPPPRETTPAPPAAPQASAPKKPERVVPGSAPAKPAKSKGRK